jgi:hypothetical protein
MNSKVTKVGRKVQNKKENGKILHTHTHTQKTFAEDN